MVPVAPRAVHLEVTSDVIKGNKSRQYALLGGLDLAVVLPQLWWDPRHTNSAEDVLFLLSPNTLAFFLPQFRHFAPPRDAEDTILTHRRFPPLSPTPAA